MTRVIRDSSAARRLFSLLLLLVLAVRVAVPIGYMPSFGAQGVMLSVCTGQGAAPALVAIPMKPGHSQDHGAPDGVCAFAAGLGAGLLTSVGPAVAFSALPKFVAPAIRAIADLTTHRLAAPPPPAQAPPALA